MADELTLGEVVRRLDDVVKGLSEVVARLERRDVYIEENFVRQKVWDAEQRVQQAIMANLNQDLGAVQRDRENDNNHRRQVWLVVAAACATSIGSAFLALLGLR